MGLWENLIRIGGGKRALVFGCAHGPESHPGSLDFLSGVYDEYECDLVVNLGDFIDMHTMSMHPKSKDLYVSEEEMRRIDSFLRPWFKKFPDMIYCMGNHDDRIAKMASSVHIPSRALKSLGEMFSFPKGWKIVGGAIIDGVLYFHGDGYASGALPAKTAAQLHGMPTVIAHHHTRSGVVEWDAGTGRMFAMNVGCLIDDSSPAFSYNKSGRERPILSCGVVLDGKYAIRIPFTG